MNKSHYRARPHYAVGLDGLVRVIDADPLYQARVRVLVPSMPNEYRPDEDGTLPADTVREYDRHAIRVGSADVTWYAEHGMRPDVAIVYLLDPSARGPDGADARSGLVGAVQRMAANHDEAAMHSRAPGAHKLAAQSLRSAARNLENGYSETLKECLECGEPATAGDLCAPCRRVNREMPPTGDM